MGLTTDIILRNKDMLENEARIKHLIENGASNIEIARALVTVDSRGLSPQIRSLLGLTQTFSLPE